MKKNDLCTITIHGYTAEGMGVSFEFGFRLVELLFGFETATVLKEQTRYA